MNHVHFETFTVWVVLFYLINFWFIVNLSLRIAIKFFDSKVQCFIVQISFMLFVFAVFKIVGASYFYLASSWLLSLLATLFWLPFVKKQVINKTRK